jgi:hypothetical protein
MSTGVNPLVTDISYTIVALGNPTLNWFAMGAPTATVNTTFTYTGTAPVGGTTTAGTVTPTPVLLIDASTNPLVSGSTYIITFLGSPALNWVAMGGAATVNSQFIYNGTAPTGGGTTPGSVYPYPTGTNKISWYTLNALYGLSLPQGASATPPTIIPSIAIKKKNLRNAWFLVKMNADIALQGSWAIQIDTYAYQFGGNTTNNYTGRWAYSMPQERGNGFNAAVATNITNTAGLLFPRLRSGFTYLLYAGDMTPAILPLQTAGTYQTGGGALFAPSQATTENTLRDPFNLFDYYPHFGMTATAYTPNATQPAYGGSSPYSDEADVEVASIYLNTDSKSPPAGIGQTTMDFNVMAFGYSGLVEGGGVETVSYATNWV